MKEFFNNKRNIIISVVSLVLVVAIVVAAVTFNNNKIDVDAGTTTTTTQAAGDGTTTEEVTEESSEVSSKTQEEDETKDNTETSTKKPETTTKKPNRTETTTRKPVTTTKPSKPEATTKQGEKITENAADLSDAELERIWNEVDCNTEAEYNEYVKNIPNYKCRYCGDHNCPAITYGPNRIGDIVVQEFDMGKCPAIKAEKIKCPNGCGRILVDAEDERWYTDPDHYCHGGCHLNFG